MNSDWMSRYNLLMFNELDSTNTEAQKLASSAPIGNFVIWAKSQTAGKGRMKRFWHSEEGNLYMSILLQLDADLDDQAQVSFVAALSVLEAISWNQAKAADIKLKWPNDVLIKGKKISGILLESVKASSKDYLIVGIGLNLASHPDLKERATTSMNEEGLRYESVEQMLNLIMNSFEKYYALWHEGYGFSKIRKLWLEKAYKFKEAITASNGPQRVSGIFEDIDSKEALVLRLASGEYCNMTACEVFFGSSDA